MMDEQFMEISATAVGRQLQVSPCSNTLSVLAVGSGSTSTSR
jgi:hypothetical protein